MNYSMIRFILFRLLRVMGTLFTLPLIVALIYKEYDSAISFLILAVICFVVGTIFTIKKPTNRVIYAKEGFEVCSEEFLEDGIPHVKMRRKITQLY